MKLTEDEIVDLIGHPEMLVRQAACDYFAQAFRDHPRLFDALRAAAEKYGGDELFAYWDWFANLAVPETHLPWLVEQAEVEDSPFGDACRFLLIAQDAAVLQRHQELWQGNVNLGLGDDTEAWLQRRLELLESSAEDAWGRLEAWAAERLGLPEEERWELTWAADALTEAAKRAPGDELKSRIKALVLESETDPEQLNYYLMPWAIRLAGLWRLEDTAEAMFRYDREANHPAVFEEVSDALARIGGEAAMSALTKDWAAWDQGERTLAALHIVNQRGPAAIDAALKLAAEMAPDPEASDILQLLGDCVLVHFDQEAGERLIAALATDKAVEPCAKSLLIWAAGLGLKDHPDRPKWPGLVEARLQTLSAREHHHCGPGCDHEHHEHEHQHEDEQCGPGCDHEHHHHGQVAHSHAEEETEIAHDSQTLRREQARVGRNDPCPCGSGKKYKKCCLNVGTAAEVIDFDF